jgi:hypothetical protein
MADCLPLSTIALPSVICYSLFFYKKQIRIVSVRKIYFYLTLLNHSIMKTFLLLFVFLAGIQPGFSQKIDSASIAKLSPEKQEEVKALLKTSNEAFIASLALVTAGGIGVIVGGIISVNELNDATEATTGPVVMLVGSIVAISSIPFTIIKGVKKKQARAIVYGQNGVSLVPGTILPNTQSVGLTRAIPLGR